MNEEYIIIAVFAILLIPFQILFSFLSYKKNKILDSILVSSSFFLAYVSNLGNAMLLLILSIMIYIIVFPVYLIMDYMKNKTNYGILKIINVVLLLINYLWYLLLIFNLNSIIFSMKSYAFPNFIYMTLILIYNVIILYIKELKKEKEEKKTKIE